MNIIESLEKNCFIDDLRQNLVFNEDEYLSLLKILNEIKDELKDKKCIDKIIAAYLYEIPKMVHIWLFNLKEDKLFSNSLLIEKLENSWIELDTIISGEILWATP